MKLSLLTENRKLQKKFHDIISVDLISSEMTPAERMKSYHSSQYIIFDMNYVSDPRLFFEVGYLCAEYGRKAFVMNLAKNSPYQIYLDENIITFNEFVELYELDKELYSNLEALAADIRNGV